MNYEAVGTIASMVVLVSFLMKGERSIRTVNILGASIFVVYGLLINAFSVWFLNSMLLLIHLVKLSKLEKERTKWRK